MQRLTIDLKKNAKVADLVSDKEPSDCIYAELCIVSKDDQSLVVEIDAVAETSSDLESADEEEDSKDESDSDEMSGDKKGEESSGKYGM